MLPDEIFWYYLEVNNLYFITQEENSDFFFIFFILQVFEIEILEKSVADGTFEILL